MKTLLVTIPTSTWKLFRFGLLAAVLLALAVPTAQAHWPNTNATKWVQFPDSSYNGLDVCLDNQSPNQLTLADDFKCILKGPVTDIHLWTSWLNNVPDMNAAFTLSIWSDVPGTTGTPSHPGSRLWTQIFGPGKYRAQLWLTNLYEGFWNPDPPPGSSMGSDFAIYQYNFYPTNPFVQNGSLSTPQTYWLCVSVTGTSQPVGWKTSTNHWNDDAVFSHMSGTNVAGDWQLIENTIAGNNLDLSFALTTAAPTNPPPPVDTNSVKYSQLPCLTSVRDTNCTNCICYELASGPQYWMADDFLCTNAGPVTDIHLWGSWLNDQPDPSPAFSISIFSDVPADPNVPGSFSQPGDQLWGDEFGPGQYTAEAVRYPDAEGFLDPVQGLLGMDYVLWQYDFYITNSAIVQPFLQQGSPVAPTNYWLVVNVAPQFVTNLFGWKISTNHYGDAAVFAAGPAGWQIAYLPTSGTGVRTCDLAFMLTTSVTQCPPPSISCTNRNVQCGAWTPVPPWAWDNCCNSNLTCPLVSSQTNGACPWTVTLVWKATDCQGQTDLCTQLVTVVDTTPPSITCVTNKTVNSGSTWSFDVPSVSDNCCSNLNLTFYDVTNSPCPLTITRMWVVTNCCSLSNDCSQTVTVMNTNTPPADTNTLKYVQWPKLIGGYDVYDKTVIFLADDFPCTNTGPINDIHIWCSYLGDAATNPPILLGIWSDEPAVGTNISHPGQLLWQQTFMPGQYQSYFWRCGAELYFAPGGAPYIYGTDSQVYYYVFYPANPFVQQGTPQTPTNYWLSVYCQDFSWFGWKTTTNVNNDAAVYGSSASWPNTTNWGVITDPINGNPLDLAFKITTSQSPLTITCPSNITVRATNYSGAVVNFSVTTNGGCPPITVTCVPTNGSTFPLGTTTVNCTATDNCGGLAACSFTVTVLPPLQPRFYRQLLLPPTNGFYLQPVPAAVTFGPSVVISNVAKRLFSAGSVPPPGLGGSLTLSCTSQLELQISLDGGTTWQPCVVSNAPTQIDMVNNGSDSGYTLYGTELQEEDLGGGSLPAGVEIRTSPTKASLGQTCIQPDSGGYRIDSFFDVFFEVSIDNGGTWTPASGPLLLELRPDPQLVTAVPAPRTVFPMPNGQYLTPTVTGLWQSYPGGIVITNLRPKLFTSWMELPLFGASLTYTFDLETDFSLSTDGGTTFYAARAPATMTVTISNVRGFQGRSTYETEVTQLAISGGDLPAGVMIRESPTKCSQGGISSLGGGGGGGAGGGAAISSFFDIFTEVSTDSGMTWTPATSGPPPEELRCMAPVYSYINNLFPTLAGRYVCTQQWSALYADGIFITNFVCRSFSAAIVPPSSGLATSHTFGSTVEFDLSQDGGSTYRHVTAPATVTVEITCRLGDDGVTEYYDTEMTELDISGGSLPAGVQIRESPTKASLGRTTTSAVGGGSSYQIDSFFDIFTEVSTDNGLSWLPTVAGPATVVLKPGQCPTLKTKEAIVAGASTVQLIWDNDGGACVLQAATTLKSPIVWNTVTSPVVTLPDGSRSVTITGLATESFYRLCGGCP
jgi:hypothetical protein